MNCPNCNSNVNPGEVFCRVCGTKIIYPTNISNIEQNNLNTNNEMISNNQFKMNDVQRLFIDNNNNNNSNSNSNSNVLNNNQFSMNNNLNFNQHINDNINDEKLIDAYIGKNADKLKKGGFSFCAFFFGFLYLFYRKMWLYGFGWLVLNIIVNSFFASFSFYIYIVVVIFAGLTFKGAYIKNVKEKVVKIKNNNKGKSIEDLMLICSREGGTAILPLIIMIILYGIVFILVFFLILVPFLLSLTSGYDTQKPDVNTSENDSNYNDKIDSDIQNPNVNTPENNSDEDDKTESNNQKLYVNIPKNFVKLHDKIEGFSFHYLRQENEVCTVATVISPINFFNSLDEFSESFVEVDDDEKIISDTYREINGNVWRVVTKRKGIDTAYIYMIFRNGIGYGVTFNVRDGSGQICNDAHNYIVNSLVFK